MQPKAEERWATIKSMALEYYALHKNRFQLWKYTGQLEEWLNKHEVIKTYPKAFPSCKFYILNFLIYVAENGIADNPGAAYDAFKEDIQKFIDKEKRFYELPTTFMETPYRQEPANILREYILGKLGFPLFYDSGYILTSMVPGYGNRMIADSETETPGGTNPDALMRMRGWGWVQSLKGIPAPYTPEDVQDEIGHMLAEAFNEQFTPYTKPWHPGR